MFKFKKGKKKQFGPVITMIILTFIIILLSLIFSLFGITGTRTVIAGDSLETSLITVKNVLTKRDLHLCLLVLWIIFKISVH